MNSSLCMDEEIAKIYNRQFDTVYRTCFSYMKNTDDAQDMVQETFLKLISCQKQFESEEHEKAWLIVTASNTCKDELRRWKRRLENIRALFTQEQDVRTKDDNILEWVMALPVKYKQVIYLYYYEGYHASEIADMLHCSESTVRNQLLRGRKLLKKNSTCHAKSVVLLAAVLTGSLLIATTAYAVYVYGLRDLHMGKEEILDLSGRNENMKETEEKEIPKKEVDIISLGGMAGSPEYKANIEWRKFLEEYDKDGTILAEIGNGFAGLPEEYELVYQCYSKEMADEVDKLCGKYELNRVKGFYLAEDYEELCRMAGIGNICKNEDGQVRWDFEDSYLYDDGTFNMEGRAAWKSSLLYTADFQLMRTMKGSFNPFTLNIGRIEDYHEWNYTTKDGQTMLLANSETKALIIAEREKSLIVINVLGDWGADIYDVSDEMLEEMAELFDFLTVP